ncbi:MAG TPA: diguanylate cyclase, partial [Stellaceae bacterium]|nr:diguanylate cyclase [Stellaceae bacterium]
SDDCLSHLSSAKFDLVLLDLRFGDRSGIEVLSAIRELESASSLPVIMITAETAGEVTVRALKEGANDYVTKPVDLNVVVARVRAQLALKAEAEQLRRRALYDPLTALPNRALLIDRLKLAFARAERSKALLGILLLDLDGFKDVNDRFGHIAGDKVLVAVADRLRQSIRKSDTVGRLGGDEFLVLAEGLHSESDAEIVKSRVEEAINTPFEVDGRPISLGVSVGVQFWRVGDSDDLDMLLGKADSSMYVAKRSRKAAR